ncbi:MAG TPA: SAM-dependent methyltransferase [Candidatus Dormibacteraeota bacterium]
MDLTVGELEVFNRAVLGGRLRDAAPGRIGGVPYVCFAADDLGERDVALLANLSSAYALFEVRGDLLRPLELRPLDRFDDDLVTIQRYPGKTNERFTRLLLNVTILTSAFRDQLLERRFAVLDPLCGRGTTLNQALLCGFDAAGIDADAQDFDAYAQFIRTWLKDKRLKHRAELATVRRDRRVIGRRLDVTLAEGIRLTAVHADTNRAREFFRARSFDVLVADLPYGVQHGSRGGGAAARLSRSPAELLAGALPVWAELLRPGGAVGLAWNTNVASREELAGVLAAGGLEVMDADPYLRFRHRVDQAIVRDVLVARR